MIASVAAFLVLASLLTWMAAWAADRALRMLDRPARFVWLAGLSVPFLLLIAPLLAPTTRSATSAGTVESILWLTPLVVEAGGTGGWGGALSWALAGAWIVSSASMVLVLVRAHAELVDQRAGCRRSFLSGRMVYVSDARVPPWPA